MTPLRTLELFAGAGTTNKAVGGAPVKPPKDDDSSDEDDGAANEAGAETCKKKGNDYFSAGNFDQAAKQFTLAIRLTPNNHVLFSNRSAAYASLGKATEALSDAEKCVKLKPDWAKGYSRLGAAQVLCGRYKEAMKAYRAGLEVEPENAGLLKGLADLKAQLRKGEAPDAQKPEGAPSAPTTAPPQPPATQPKPSKKKDVSSAAPPPSHLPIGQQWIEAAKKGDRATMETLLQGSGGEDLVAYKARGIGHTAMHWAAAGGDRQLMAWLLSLDATVNARNNSEATPLHTAAGAAQFMSVEWLLEHGADPTLQNDDGFTPAVVARKKNRLDIACEIEKGPRAPPRSEQPQSSAGPPANNLPPGMDAVLEREEVD